MRPKTRKLLRLSNMDKQKLWDKEGQRVRLVLGKKKADFTVIPDVDLTRFYDQNDDSKVSRWKTGWVTVLLMELEEPHK